MIRNSYPSAVMVQTSKTYHWLA